MTNWRSIAFVVAAPVLAVCLLLFIRGLRKPDPSATLTGKLEKLVGDWTVNKVPVNILGHLACPRAARRPAPVEIMLKSSAEGSVKKLDI